DVSSLASIFDQSNWNFSPVEILDEETSRIATAIGETEPSAFLRIVPGKQLTAVAATYVGMSKPNFIALLIGALNHPDDSPLSSLRDALIAASQGHLPQRTLPVSQDRIGN
ncbi:MAG: hypothetical protein ABIQ09_07370, partial [Jatrophihabitantaceae bacterium]